MKNLFGQSWKTTIAGFFAAAGAAMATSSNSAVSTFGIVLNILSMLILGKQAGDSTQVKEVKKDLHETRLDNNLN